jgi:hypothetical protein
MKNIKLAKRISIITIFIISCFFTTKANVNLSAFSVQDYYANGYFNIPNPSSQTPFKFNVTLSRQLLSTGGYEDGTSTVTLVYSNCGECGTYTQVSTPKQVSNANFVQGSTTWPYGWANLVLDAILPANIQSGFLMIKLTKYDTINKKNVTEYLATNRVNVRYTPPTQPPTVTEIYDLVTYPARRQSEANINYGVYEFESRPFGIKLPNEQLQLTWNASKLTSTEVYITLYDQSSNLSGPIQITKLKVNNSGNYSLDFTSLQVKFYDYKYFVVIEELSGNKLGRSCMFRFINDHLNYWHSELPNAFTNSAWIFKPDSSGSGSPDMGVDWFPDRVKGSNVSIDLYKSDGTFYKRLVDSTPNDGHYDQADTSIPSGSGMFYQYKISSIEDPSQYGFSDVYQYWYD